MAELTVAIDAEQINKYVADAILDSALGANLKQAIDKAVQAITQPAGYNSPSTLEKVVSEEVARTLHKALTSEPYESQIAAIVQESLTEEALRRIANTSLTRLFDAIDRAKDYR